jgi:XTP/dITP diphosphohydrolase
MDLAEAGIPERATTSWKRATHSRPMLCPRRRHYFEASGGIPTVADDSGIEVAALDGAPGVASKRWSGRADLSGQALDDANNAVLVATLVGREDRRARYVCAAVFVDAAGELVERGETTGVILDRPRGTGGFGYDPYFLSDELGVTFGEAPPAEKHRVSHRGRAFRALAARLSELGGR